MGVLDNKDQIKKLLKFGKDTFYYLQVLQRRKENPELELPEIKRWRLFIPDLKTLDRSDKYIEFLCKSLNARAYISLLPRDLKKHSIAVIKTLVDRLEQDNFDQSFRIMDRVALDKSTVKWKGIIPNSRLLLDFDEPKYSRKDIEDFLKRQGFMLEDIIPTKNGFHSIVQNCSPEHLLGLDHKCKDNNIKFEDDILGGEIEFTIIRECNTIYYASWS